MALPGETTRKRNKTRRRVRVLFEWAGLAGRKGGRPRMWWCRLLPATHRGFDQHDRADRRDCQEEAPGPANAVGHDCDLLEMKVDESVRVASNLRTGAHAVDATKVRGPNRTCGACPTAPSVPHRTPASRTRGTTVPITAYRPLIPVSSRTGPSVPCRRARRIAALLRRGGRRGGRGIRRLTLATPIRGWRRRPRRPMPRRSMTRMDASLRGSASA